MNPFDPYVANKTINGKQHVVTWHVHDIEASHVDPSINDLFYGWCENMYGSKENGHVTVTRGKKHNYLAMNFDLLEKRETKSR